GSAVGVGGGLPGDPGAAHPAGRLDLTTEAGPERRVRGGRAPGPDELQGRRPVLRVVGEVDDAHAARTEAAHDVEPGDLPRVAGAKGIDRPPARPGLGHLR